MAAPGQVLGSPPILHAPIDHGSNGSNVIVAAVGGKRIRVVAFQFITDAAVTVTWKSGTSGGTVISGLQHHIANGGMAPGGMAAPLFSTLVGEQLNLFLGSAVHVGGSLSYFLSD